MVEKVSVIKGSAATASFNFGYNVGVMDTLAFASGHMVDKVPPKQWQKAVGVRSTTKAGPALKQEVASICDRLYPGVNIRGPKGGLKDGYSDALMIAHYCYLKHKME